MEALKIAETDYTRDDISFDIRRLAEIEEGRAALIAAGACFALVVSLFIAFVMHATS